MAICDKCKREFPDSELKTIPGRYSFKICEDCDLELDAKIRKDFFRMLPDYLFTKPASDLIVKRVTSNKKIPFISNNLMKILLHEAKEKGLEPLVDVGKDRMLDIKLLLAISAIDREDLVSAYKIIHHILSWNSYLYFTSDQARRILSFLLQSNPIEYYEEHAKSHCFIATSIYGNAHCAEVLILRNFKDNILSDSIPGIVIIFLYELIGPIIAKYIGRSKHIKSISKWCLDTIVQKITRNNIDHLNLSNLENTIYSFNFQKHYKHEIESNHIRCKTEE